MPEIAIVLLDVAIVAYIARGVALGLEAPRLARAVVVAAVVATLILVTRTLELPAPETTAGGAYSVNQSISY